MEQYVLRHKDGGYLFRDSNGKWSRTPRISNAERLTCDKAHNVLQNCIHPNLREFWEVVRAETVPSVAFSAVTANDTEFDWEDLSSRQHDLFRRMQQYGEECRQELQKIEMEICDIEHYIEFFALDAARGYKAYKMLRERLTRRRFLKDEIAKSSCMMNGTAFDFSSGKIDHAIKGFDFRRYSPRVLNELFGSESSIA